MKLDNVEEVVYKIDVVAFTGTQIGMTPLQRRSFEKTLIEVSPQVLIHGDCIGADAQAHDIAVSLGLEVWIRPCNIHYKRAYKEGKILSPPEDPLVRNRKMVDQAQALIACPKEMKQQLRSGTWATVRYASKIDILKWIVYPDGSVVTPLGE